MSHLSFSVQVVLFIFFFFFLGLTAVAVNHIDNLSAYLLETVPMLNTKSIAAMTIIDLVIIDNIIKVTKITQGSE